MTKYAGATWLEKSCKKTLSPLGKEVADILGQVFNGLYHIQSAVLSKKVDWNNGHHIEICIGEELGTFDFGLLTKLVLYCHARKIRCGITGASSKYLRLIFHNSPKHPSIEESIIKYSKDIESLTQGLVEDLP